jgi:outer membrane receptor for ferrienterochelin and colicins
MFRGLIYLFLILSPSYLFGQSVLLQGRILERAKGLEEVWIQCEQSEKGVFSNAKGEFAIEIAPVFPQNLLFKKLGFKSLEVQILDASFIEIQMIPQDMVMKEVVVSASRREQDAMESTIAVRVLSNRDINRGGTADLSEGLKFKPGLRIENNCSNCGFTQLRLNGLDGPYTQILINSRPVFSALAGVYGLEQINPQMVERVEIIKGAGSALYGSNAIAGTVNIISLEPLENALSFSSQAAFLKGGIPDLRQAFHAGLKSKNSDAGLSLFGSNRTRHAWDADADGYSEITKVEQNNIGFRGNIKLSEKTKWEADMLYLKEFRRGGSHLELEPHLADLAEQLKHDVWGGGSSLWHQFNPNVKAGLYGAFQTIRRESYYGSGGHTQTLQDEGLSDEEIQQSLDMALKSYGLTEDNSFNIGAQVFFDRQKHSFTGGFEFTQNAVSDNMPGYFRIIDQQVRSMAVFAQWEWRINSIFELHSGTRFDQLNLRGNYSYESIQVNQQKKIPVVVPRISGLYRLAQNQRLRLSYGRGFRAPQAFDEDLHVDLVGGTPRFVRLSDQLKPEFSDAFSLSFDQVQGNYILAIDGFFNLLSNPFYTVLLSEEELMVNEKRNAPFKGISRGINAEIKHNKNLNGSWQVGGTLQQAFYDRHISLSESNEGVVEVSSNQMLRTPNWYGYFLADRRLYASGRINFAVNFTGPMQVLYQGEQREIDLVKTPSFAEIDLFYKQLLKLGTYTGLEIQAGVRNIFNAFQRDFESGRNRDATYIYGPLRPRTIFISLNLNLEGKH